MTENSGGKRVFSRVSARIWAWLAVGAACGLIYQAAQSARFEYGGVLVMPRVGGNYPFDMNELLSQFDRIGVARAPGTRMKIRRSGILEMTVRANSTSLEQSRAEVERVVSEIEKKYRDRYDSIYNQDRDSLESIKREIQRINDLVTRYSKGGTRSLADQYYLFQLRKDSIDLALKKSHFERILGPDMSGFFEFRPSGPGERTGAGGTDYAVSALLGALLGAALGFVARRIKSGA